jgi:hypothetical protein
MAVDESMAQLVTIEAIALQQRRATEMIVIVRVESGASESFTYHGLSCFIQLRECDRLEGVACCLLPILRIYWLTLKLSCERTTMGKLYPEVGSRSLMVIDCLPLRPCHRRPVVGIGLSLMFPPSNGILARELYTIATKDTT